ncbi:MAG: hypothetical protein ACXW6K_13655 [Candidatus Binatia bacterium]
MNGELTRRQAKVPLLLTLPVESACQQAKLAKPTFYGWLKQDHFKAALKKAQDEIFSDSIGRIKGSVGKAVETLTTLMDSADRQISLRACEKVIEYAIKLAVADEFERRLAELEKATNERPPYRQ